MVSTRKDEAIVVVERDAGVTRASLNSALDTTAYRLASWEPAEPGWQPGQE